MGKKRSSGKSKRTQMRRKQEGGFFNLPSIIGSLFRGRASQPRRRPPPRRRMPPPDYYSMRGGPPMRAERRSVRKRPPPMKKRQQGGFLADSVNYGFEESQVKQIKRKKKQKGGSAQPLNKIPWVKRVNIS